MKIITVETLQGYNYEELGVVSGSTIQSKNFVSDFGQGIKSIVVLIAQYISKTVGSEIIDYDMAGSLYKGAVEDTCNLRGIPAVTCEVLSPFASVGKGSFEKSLEQMKSFLEYFGF